MTAFWLTYKPLSPAAPRGWPAAKMDALVGRFEADKTSATPLWRIASSRAASVGDRVYLFKQGAGPRGIFAVGELIEAPREQIDPDDIEGGAAVRAKIRLTQLVNPAQDFLLDYDAIADIVPKTLVDARQSGDSVPDDVAGELDRRLALVADSVPLLESSDADDLSFDPDSVSDERERATRAIRIRRGQADFRATLMVAYGRRCAITGCAVEDVLEAAHIHPYFGKLSNHASNGLLLRADIHTLFDCWLIAIDPNSRTVIVADALKTSSYAKLVGRKLRAARDASSGASKRCLEWRYESFKARRAR